MHTQEVFARASVRSSRHDDSDALVLRHARRSRPTKSLQIGGYIRAIASSNIRAVSPCPGSTIECHRCDLCCRYLFLACRKGNKIASSLPTAVKRRNARTELSLISLRRTVRQEQF